MIGFALNLILVSLFVFTLLRLVPGDAAANILGAEARPEALVAFREKHGLTGSFFEQYTRWAGGILQACTIEVVWLRAAFRRYEPLRQPVR
jgi:peptide/nickel transport system permease protein